MADDITNVMLLRYLERMKADLERQITALNEKLSGRIDRLEVTMGNLTVEMRTEFEEAHQHRQSLQEDLEATMRMLAKHERKLAKM